MSGIAPDIRTKAVQLYKDGMSSRQVADRLGISYTTVCRWAAQAGISRPSHRRRKPIRHGTYGGYAAHLRRDEELCTGCRRARRDYDWAKRARAIS